VLAILLVLGGLYHVLSEARIEGRTRVQYEDLAASRLDGVVAAELVFHQRTGRYGWLYELKAVGLLKGLATDRAEGEEYLASPRYRIDVLLPHSMSPTDKVRLALRGAGHHNPNLEERHFSVVARPWGEALSGYRTFCRDETGHTYVSEGVSDTASRTNPPLPDVHLGYGNPLYAGGLRWYRLDQLPER